MLTDHALEEMAEDGLAEDDIEESILAGQIVRVQRDHLDRRKYTIEGRSVTGRRMKAVCRYSDSGERLVIITVYAVEED
ncbi:MAG: DUF4258 domain-containing protein [candidate division NC10 bacterium]